MKNDELDTLQKHAESIRDSLPRLAVDDEGQVITLYGDTDSIEPVPLSDLIQMIGNARREAVQMANALANKPRRAGTRKAAP